MSLEPLSANRCFGGWQKRFSHPSRVLDCTMNFSVYLPPQVDAGGRVPVLYWLSGLTCTDENFTQKAGAQRVAAALGLALVMPDTSPRGEGVADDVAYDLGQGAGFYVNATQTPWRDHYRMYDYVLDELPSLVEQHFPVTAARAISGHSMGGHGALVLAFRNPERYASVSAFSPICNPVKAPWGRKAFGAYLGADESRWSDYDASKLLAEAAWVPPIQVDLGLADEFRQRELMPEALELAAKANGGEFCLRQHAGYDHSYFFVASFIEDHLHFHARYLGLEG
ncbi:S-formylglutathione hydrolase [Motiliproteus sp. SC1-56]|uniref:S-formylglutathione hydrolase n=1 Tax=Motiliproteus sp. SC1-56 TaxID=2799565 RepID=UPI00272AD20C|nr:S-formylglutathione hydrolase [Motiliproteus sp. SC1-56]